MAWKRHLARAIFLAVLAAIGYAVHMLLPPVPRWELQGPSEIIGLTSNNRHFWTIALDAKGGDDGGRRGPLQLRELARGAIVAEYLKSEPSVFEGLMSSSGRFVAGQIF